jgi:hypothetical protein
LSTEGVTRQWRGRFIYGGEDSSTEARLFYSIFLRKSRILASVTDKGQRIRGGGTEDRKQRSKGHKQWNRANIFKGEIGTVDRQGTLDRDGRRGQRNG